MKKIVLLGLLLAGFLPCRAEVSPLPQIRFSLSYEQPTAATPNAYAAELLLCQDRLCMQATALGEYGSQRMQCDTRTCVATAYEFEPYARFTLLQPNGEMLASNVFAVPHTLLNHFQVTLSPTQIRVTAAPAQAPQAVWKQPQAWGALLLILVLELLCAAAYILYTQKRFTILYGVAFANLVTAALIWGVLAHYIAQSAVWWICGVATETVLVRLINYKDISLKDSATLCIMTNVTSYTLGMILSFMLTQF